ncbi:hypothetical protein NYO67_4595 [Aspergillus flavus]|nr:hypothetical protein NYO67_4595 [Aspergillus flavus]
MKTYGILSCIASVGLGAVLGRDAMPPQLDPNRDHQVLNVTSFPIDYFYHGGGFHARATDEIIKPQCFPDRYGIARMNETNSNIVHLHDVAAEAKKCVALPGSCARVSHVGHSSIFMCNHLDQPIETMCVDLIDAATQLSAACRFGSRYTYGYMTNNTAGPDSYPYVVALGDDNSDSCGSP